MAKMTWVVEADAFGSRYQAFISAIKAAGHRCLPWDDDWWSTGSVPQLDGPAVFHGSLGNADRIAKEIAWRPGAYCKTSAFHCSAWYPGATSWLLHTEWVKTTVQALVDAPEAVAGAMASEGQVFVRPDSPLKPFSGRVCTLAGLTLQALDYGFYYEDPHIPIVVAPIRKIEREWRFVVADRRVVAHSGYEADGRRGIEDEEHDVPIAFAQEIASGLDAPESVYVLDVCQAEGKLFLLELNPFSGADLYACDPAAVVEAVSAVSLKNAV